MRREQLQMFRSAQHESNPGFLAVAKRAPGIENVAYFELVLRVVVEIRSSTSFGLPIASTSLPV
jgi:hypothetical protein